MTRLAFACVAAVWLAASPVVAADRCAAPRPPAGFIAVTEWRPLRTVGVTNAQIAAVRAKGMALKRVCPSGNRIFGDGRQLYALRVASGSPAWFCQRGFAFYLEPLGASIALEHAC